MGWSSSLWTFDGSVLVAADQSLDPPYGGSLDNRLRFTIEVLRAMRRRIGDEFILGMRYTGDELLEGGIGKEGGLEISRRLKTAA